MPAWLAISVQDTPSVTAAHLLQLSGEPDMVGAGGVGLVVVGTRVVVVVDHQELDVLEATQRRGRTTGGFGRSTSPRALEGEGLVACVTGDDEGLRVAVEPRAGTPTTDLSGMARRAAADAPTAVS